MASESFPWVYCKWQRCNKTGTGALQCYCTGEVVHFDDINTYAPTLLSKCPQYYFSEESLIFQRPIPLLLLWLFSGVGYSMFYSFFLFSCCLKWHFGSKCVFWCYINNLLILRAQWNTNSNRRWGRLANETAKPLLGVFSNHTACCGHMNLGGEKKKFLQNIFS